MFYSNKDGIGYLVTKSFIAVENYKGIKSIRIDWFLPESYPEKIFENLKMITYKG